MKSKLVLTAVVALSALTGCGATPDRGPGTSQTGGTTSAGGATGAGGGGAGGAESSGGAAGNGNGGATVTSSGGTTVKSSGGATGTASGGTTVNPSGGAAGNSSGGAAGDSSGGATGNPSGGAAGNSSGGTTVKASGGSASGGSQAGGVQSSGGATGLGGATSQGGSTGTAPCDIYAAASTPCAAAHSTVRALYSAYTGPLYQLRKKSDSSVKDVPVGAGGFVDIATHNTFCPSGTACTISILYDQSPNKNDLKKSGTALWLKNGGNEADASLGQITVGGHVAHGIFVDNDGGTGKDVGYRNNATKGMATGDQPEAMYAVLDGKRYSGTCCFDYGNAETTNSDSRQQDDGGPLLGQLHAVSEGGSWHRPVGSRRISKTACSSAILQTPSVQPIPP
jgi:hypothetical protein